MPRRIRRALLGTALSVAATAGLLAGTAGTAHAAPIVYAVDLQWIAVQVNQDNNTIDEVFVKVNGSTVWGPKDMLYGTTEYLSSLPVYYYDSDHTLTIEAWDKDPGADDRVGTIRLGATPQLGFQVVRLAGNDGVYYMDFNVYRVN